MACGMRVEKVCLSSPLRIFMFCSVVAAFACTAVSSTMGAFDQEARSGFSFSSGGVGARGTPRQLVLLLSDGRFDRENKDRLRRLVREMNERGQLLVLIGERPSNADDWCLYRRFVIERAVIVQAFIRSCPRGFLTLTHFLFWLLCWYVATA